MLNKDEVFVKWRGREMEISVCLQKCSFQGQSQQLLTKCPESEHRLQKPCPSSSPAAQHHLGVLLCANESIDTSPTLPSRLRRSVQEDSSPQQCNAMASLPWFYFPLVTQECGQSGTRNRNNRSPKRYSFDCRSSSYICWSLGRGRGLRLWLLQSCCC